MGFYYLLCKDFLKYGVSLLLYFQRIPAGKKFIVDKLLIY
jgi:hypothetical protein